MPKYVRPSNIRVLNLICHSIIFKILQELEVIYIFVMIDSFSNIGYQTSKKYGTYYKHLNPLNDCLPLGNTIDSY